MDLLLQHLVLQLVLDGYGKIYMWKKPQLGHGVFGDLEDALPI